MPASEALLHSEINQPNRQAAPHYLVLVLVAVSHRLHPLNPFSVHNQRSASRTQVSEVRQPVQASVKVDHRSLKLVSVRQHRHLV